MTIAIASDHAGFRMKEQLRESLKDAGHLVLDMGAHDDRPSDYPDFAEAVGRAIQEGRAERGILLCGSGVGASVAANKMKGIRAGLCHDSYSSHQGVEHDDMNVLVLGARVVGAELAEELVHYFLAARFDRTKRHVDRLNKVVRLEQSS